MNFQNNFNSNYGYNQPNSQFQQNMNFNFNNNNNNNNYNLNNQNNNMNTNNNNNNSQNQDNQYLISRKLKDISNDEFTDFISSLNISGLKELKKNIECLEPNNKMVGEFNTLGSLIEKFYGYKEERHRIMVEKYKLLTQDIFKHRTIYGDGNCFYRSVIFSYLEQLILFKELNTIKNFIFDVKAFLYSNYVQEICERLDNPPKFDRLLIIRVLVLLYLGVKNNKIKDTYSLFIKAFNNLTLFDEGIIMYFRFSLFRYIKENENKLYSKEFAIQIGNLLPEQFETKDGKFLFKDFYYKFLLKPGKLAEKIIIYMTPYVLCSKLEVVMFEMESDWRKSFVFSGEKNTNNNLNTVLIYLPGHYELIYTNEFYQRFYGVFKNYSDFSYRNQVMTEIVEEQRCNNKTLLDMNSEITSTNNNNDFFGNINQNNNNNTMGNNYNNNNYNNNNYNNFNNNNNNNFFNNNNFNNNNNNFNNGNNNNSFGNNSNNFFGNNNNFNNNMNNNFNMNNNNFNNNNNYSNNFNNNNNFNNKNNSNNFNNNNNNNFNNNNFNNNNFNNNNFNNNNFNNNNFNNNNNNFSQNNGNNNNFMNNNMNSQRNNFFS